MAQAPSQQALLLFRVGPIFCCAGSAPVTAIIEPRPLSHPPGSTAAAPGIFKHTGKIVRCRDLRYLFGVTPTVTTAPQRLVITDRPDGPIGFYVDEIIEVMAMPATGFGPLPALLPRGVFSRTLLLDQHIYLVTEFAALATLQGSGYLRRYLAQLQAPLPPTATVAAASNPQAVPQRIVTPELPPAKPDRDTTPAPKALRPTPAGPAIPSVTHTTTRHAANATPAVRNVQRTRGISPRRPLAASEPLRQIAAPVNSVPVVSRLMPRQPDSSNRVGSASTAVPVKPTAPPSFLPASLLVVLFVGGLAGMVWWWLAPPATSSPPAIMNPLSVAMPSPDLTSTPLPVTSPTTVPSAKDLPTSAVGTVTPPPHYQASIARDKAGITIELVAPPDDPVFSPAPSAQAASPAITLAQTTPSAPAPSSPAQTEIIHIVVPGDTLWSIAKRYVNDPYRYPELARLSQIANPDLIYPGNRVRIIKKYRK